MRTIFSSDNSQSMITFIKSLLFLLVTTSFMAFLLYFGVSYLFFGSALYSPTIHIVLGYRGAAIWEIAKHPFPFLLSISLIFAISGAIWTTIIAPRWPSRHTLQILVIPWIAVNLTSPIWGLIWSIYHWQPPNSYDSATIIYFHKHDMLTGLQLGWLSAIQSFPVNILSYITVCILLFINKKLYLSSGNGLAK